MADTPERPTSALPAELDQLPVSVPLLRAGQLLGLSRNVTYGLARRRRELELAGKAVDPDRDPSVFPLRVRYLGRGQLPRGFVPRSELIRHLGYEVA